MQTFPNVTLSKITAAEFKYQKPRKTGLRNAAVQLIGSIRGNLMNNIVYIVGAVVIILAILSFLGFR